MEFDGITVIGLTAAVLTTLAFLPKVIKTWRTRSARDISLVMFLMLVTGICLWLTYGVLIADIPLIAANIVTLALAAIILYFKLRFG